MSEPGAVKKLFSYMVLFRRDEGYVPPQGVEGGIMGHTDKGVMAVYRVPEVQSAAFERSLAGRAEVTKCQRLQLDRKTEK
jgi:hypothetical protein